MSVAIGIDLGTTYSCVAALVQDKIEVIADSEGERTTPSCVAFTEEQVIVGKFAVEQAPINAENTVFDIKRIMGMRYAEESVQKDMKHWPFKVVPANGGSAAVAVKYMEQTKQYSPEQISAMILGKMKETAERYLNCKIDKAVITVPAYFNNNQREATIDAAKIAGLDVLQIINEPTAAALAYGVQRPRDKPRKVLVFDFGGGTLDVTILNVSAKQFEVIATDGDSHLGGEDFVTALMDHCIEQFEKVNKLTVERTPDMLQELRDECEKAKKALSSERLVQIQIREFFDEKNLNVHVFQADFEKLCDPLLKRAITLVRQTLKAANAMSKDEIDEVLLVGGSTRIPRMQQMLSKFFGGLDLSRTVPPDHAVAYGAAVQAASLSGNKSFGVVSLSDVIPLSLGIEEYHGRMSMLIKRNSRIPASATKCHSTVEDNQTSVLLKVYEGEHKFITPLPRNKTHIEVTFDVDANGIIHVSARNTKTGKLESVMITNKGRLSKEEIEEKQRDADLNAKRDSVQRKRVEEQNKLEQLCGVVRRGVESINVDKAERKTVTAKCEELSEWLHANQQEAPEVYDRKLNQLDKMYNSLCKRAKLDDAD